METLMIRLQRFKELEANIAVVCMVFLVLITLGNVVTRYLTDQSFAWTEEISIFLMLVMTFAGAASMATKDQHIRIEFLYEGGSARRQAKLRMFSACATSVFFLVLAYLFGLLLIDEIKYAETTMGLGLPRWWFTVWLPFLCIAIAARAIRFAWNSASIKPLTVDQS
jgi:TRAP-type transport system small permease protein